MTRTRLTFSLGATIAAFLLAVVVPASAVGGETPIVVRVERGGFGWADAGIGALVGAGLVVAAFGCAALVRTRDRTSGQPTRKESDR